MEIDPRFKAARKSAVRRRARPTYGPVVLWGGAAVVAIWFSFALWNSGILTAPQGKVGPDHEATQDHDHGVGDAVQYASPFIDLAGDPMLLRFDASAVGADKSRKLLRPPGLAAIRVGDELVLLTDELVTGQERLITTLPSSREDFAFFQAQRAMPAAPPPAPAPAPAMPADMPPDEVADIDAVASWGENLDGSADTAGSFTPTRIEDTTSLAFVLPEPARKAETEDVILRLKEAGKLVDLLIANGLDPAASALFAESAAMILPETASLNAGHILAIRGVLRGGMRVPVQLSLYTRDSYLGSVALDDAGAVVAGADPWVAEDLFAFAGDEAPTGTDAGRKFRLLDAFYSVAIRNGVPSAIVGETIVLMSQAHDLEAFAIPGDRMTLLYSREAGTGGPGPGQVLYAAIRGEGRTLECHVFADGSGTYACADIAGTPRPGGAALRNGLILPVQGVVTSGFGPRMHPVLKVAKQHQGVDWAAPVGTPILAGFDGTVRSAGDGGNYGNVVILDHEGGMETRYAHMHAFVEGMRPGLAVKAGEMIGFVGSTGMSTGPHLHFELRIGGEAVDPFAGGGADALAGSAVEQLTDRIIRVESAGVATAKNPLSTATGLGQFIEGTWLRMMTAYRPDLAGTLTREGLLALRTDPTISREMVANLAREGEAYLRARGHSITAGRLYLCHFLGADGADRVLKSTDDQMLVDVLGAGVINANPFLTGKTVAYVKDWAERKMTGAAPMQAAVVVPPEVLAYAKVIAEIIKPPA